MINQAVKNNVIAFPSSYKFKVLTPDFSASESSNKYKFKVSNNSLKSFGILANDLLICDYSEDPKIKSNSLCILKLDGQLVPYFVTLRKDGKAKLTNDLTVNIYYQEDFKIIAVVRKIERELV